ncbi:MAG: DUF1330 domain-containing protein [Chromatocurvus sp.]
MSSIDPTREQFDAFKSLPRDTPINMLNLIRFNDTAVYPDGERVPGAEAYARYGKHSGPIFRKLGGEILWRGRGECMVIGPAEEAWDVAFVARYPSAAAFMAMVTDPDYQAIVIHRQVAVADSRLVRLAAEDAGGGFGG